MVRRPQLKLAVPCRHGREWYDHKERSVELVVVGEVVEERDGLNGLAQSHLICQYDRVVPYTETTHWE